MRPVLLASFLGTLLLAAQASAQESADKGKISVGGSLKGDLTGTGKEAKASSEVSTQTEAAAPTPPEDKQPPATPTEASRAAEPSKAPEPPSPELAPKKEEPESSSTTKTHWFWPRHADRHLYIKQPKAKVERAEWALGVVYDIHPFITGAVDGWAHEVRAVFGRDWVGVSAGLYSPDGRLSLGLDFGRNLGFEMDCKESPYQYSFLTPTFEPRVLLDWKRGEPIVALGVAWAGFRVARYPLALDMRFPRTDLFIDPESGRAALSLGLSLGGSYGF